jgi:hypothetical protein
VSASYRSHGVKDEPESHNVHQDVSRPSDGLMMGKAEAVEKENAA